MNDASPSLASAHSQDAFRALARSVGQQTQGLGPLLLEFGHPERALHAPDERLAQLPPATQLAVFRARDQWPCDQRPCGRESTYAEPTVAARGRSYSSPRTTFTPITAEAYPDRLRQTPDPPPWLFHRGSLDCLKGPAVAVVGSRRASKGGLQAAERIAESLAAGGYTICSGLALGIDAAAHRGALRGGTTAAVLASGVDRPSPHRHGALAQELLREGCLLSELPDGAPPTKAGFPRRNRIISGLCEATVIVEAALRSGSLHTASAALEQGRDVFVLPWSVYHEQGAGCLALLRDGAQPITDLDDLTNLFPRLSPAAEGSRALRGVSRRDDSSVVGRRILNCLGDEPAIFDDVQRASGLSVDDFLAAVAELEVDGWVGRSDGRLVRL